MADNKWVNGVQRFQDVFEKPFVPTTDKDWARMIKLRLDLVHEENCEFMRGIENILCAIRDGDQRSLQDAKVETLDAIVDSIYVLIGTANKLGWDIEGAFDEVQKSNMSKADENGLPIYNAVGKVMKGPNFRPPRLEQFVK